MKFLAYILIGILTYLGFYYFGNTAIDAAKKVELDQIYYLGQDHQISQSELKEKTNRLASKFDLYKNKGLLDALQTNPSITNIKISESEIQPGIKLVTYSFNIDKVNRVEFDFSIADKIFIPKTGTNPFERTSAQFITANELRIYKDEELVSDRTPDLNNEMSLSRDDQKLLTVLISLYSKDQQKALAEIRRLIEQAPKSNKRILAEIREEISKNDKKESLLACFNYNVASDENIKKEISALDKKPIESTDLAAIYSSCKIEVANSSTDWKKPETEFVGDIEGRILESSNLIAMFKPNQETEFPSGYVAKKGSNPAEKIRQGCANKTACTIANAKISKKLDVAIGREATAAFGGASSFAITWYQIIDIPNQ